MTEYDRYLEPPEEKAQWHRVKVKITLEYEGDFYGTVESVEEDARDYFHRNLHEYDDETTESEVDDD